MAELTHFSKPYLGQLETGKREASREHASAYEEALGTRLSFTTDQITLTDVALLADLTNSIAKVGLRHGGVAISEMGKAHWSWAEGLLSQAMPDDVRTALQNQTAQLADRVAWSLGDIGRPDRAMQFYKKALDLAEHDRHVRGVVTVNLAGHLIDNRQPVAALAHLDEIARPTPVVAFTAHAARAEAFAHLGRWQETVREIGLADQAHAEVDMSQLPPTHAPYASGHAAHAHRSAGTALHMLAQRGEKRAAPLALDRLTSAIVHFGPERARTIAKCKTLLADLA